MRTVARLLRELVPPTAVLLAAALVLVLLLSACRPDGAADGETAFSERTRLHEEQRAAVMRRQVPTHVGGVDGVRLYRVREPESRRFIYFTSAGCMAAELPR
ncbi:hypothetical protein EOD42_22240 [Rhodovarius crocodyli]|uniref:Uncharacterized protein n=1 Tax=Rhodovarius crocodyli TaxID=1979269 RepID=A0A437M111_9PROT|nr:hypothetical protein [Rhodovarius crocodyli]RVT91377.1 hypothetical protein EOD42_22240 [Rhodovarius crocodyli]